MGTIVDTFKTFRMKCVFVLLSIYLVAICTVTGCKNEIQGAIESFVKGKDFNVLFSEYANKGGYIGANEMDSFLYDAEVSYICRWPTQVIDEFDQDSDGALSYEEINAALVKFQNQKRDEL